MKKIMGMIIVTFVMFIVGCSVPTDLSSNNDKAINDNKTTVQRGSLLVDRGDYYVLGGDILLDKRDAGHQKIIDALLNTDNESGRGVKGIYVSTWPNNEIPYYFSGTFTNTEKDGIKAAMLNLEMACNVDFYETSAGDYRYKIMKNTDPNVGGASTLGYSQYPRYEYGSSTHGVIVHELMHGLGFAHEHQRYDRDNFVTIDWDNIKEDYKSNYEIIPKEINFMFGGKIPYSRVYGAYDYDSVMHYTNGINSSFAIDPTKLIIDTNGNAVGQRTHLSNTDRLSLITVYGEPENKYYSGNFDRLGGDDVLIVSNWGIGIQKYNNSTLETILYKGNGTRFGGWLFNSEDNVIEGIGDFDGDGDDDILVSSPWGIGVLTKSGTSLTSLVCKPKDTWFGSWRFNASVNTGNDVIQGIGDFNNDGKDDILITSSWGVGILTKSGSTFTTLVCKANGTRFGGWLFNSEDNVIEGIGDFDGDGDDDVLISSPWGIGILRKSGSSMYASVCKPKDTWFGGWRYNASVNTGSDVVQGIGDFDQNGIDDILITSSWGVGILTKSGTTLTSLIYKANGTWFGSWNFNSADNVIEGIGDFDGDGDDDVLISSPWGIGILRKSGTSMYTIMARAKDTWFGSWRYNASVNTGSDVIHTLCDVNNNGRADVVISSSWGMGVLTRSGSTMTSLITRAYTTPWWSWNH